MKKKITRILSILLPLAVGVFLVLYTYNNLTDKDRADVAYSFVTADYFYVTLAMLGGFTGFAARAYRWKYTLAHMGYTAPFGVKFSAVCITYLMNMLIPRSGEVSRALVLKKYADVPFDKGLGTIISERVVDLFLLLFCIGATVFMKFDELRDYLIATVPYQKLLVYGAAALLIFISGILFYMYSRATWLLKLKDKISGLVEGSLSVFKMPNKWPFLLLSVYIWFTYVAMFYIAIYALPQTSGLSFATVVTTFVVGSITITFTNGGVGFFPVAVANVLAMYGVPFTAGTAFGWIVWGSQVIQVIFLGVVSFLILPLLYRKK